MKVELQRVAPAEIEQRSMEIITAELGERSFPPEVLPVVKRVIHTTADFDYAGNLVFSPGAVARGVEALRSGCTIVTDTQMARAGINKRVLEGFGGHELAAGLTVSADRVDELRARLRAYAEEHVSMAELVPQQNIDCMVRPEWLTMANI